MTNKIERVRVLHGHTSADTAYTVDDYPYGFQLRCKIRYWVETGAKGASKGRQRFVSQTTNPKRVGEVWNKPKASTYSLLVFLFLDAEDHVHAFHVSDYGVEPESDALIRLMGIYEQMSEADRRVYDSAVRTSKAYVDPWDSFEAVVSAMAEQVRRGEEPQVDGRSWFDPVQQRERYLGRPDIYLAEAKRRATE